MVVSVKNMGTSEGEDQIGCEKHQPEFYPASRPSPSAPSACQEWAYQPANDRNDRRSHNRDEDLRQ
jgi:hypothetical protein